MCGGAGISDVREVRCTSACAMCDLGDALDDDGLRPVDCAADGAEGALVDFLADGDVLGTNLETPV